MSAFQLRSSDPNEPAVQGLTDLSRRIVGYLQDHGGRAWSLLIDGRTAEAPNAAMLQEVNDLVYSLYFLDWPAEPGEIGAAAFRTFLESVPLAAGLNGSAPGKPISVHGTAYTLGALALLKSRGQDLFDQVMTPERWSLSAIVDARTLLPRWPWQWSHHSWRVSHWIGGSAAIVHELARQMPSAYHAAGGPDPAAVLAAADRLIDQRTGLLRCYRSRRVQALFRKAYRLRHDPMLGDIGGVVHVHWVNYHRGRPYKAGKQLFERARAAMLEHRPFMEKAPYCLDFDIVQIARTAMPDDLPASQREELMVRAHAYAEDILTFLDARLGPDFVLHKLPGALATIHECALIDPSISLERLHRSPDGAWPRDVMHEVAWL